MLCICGIMLLNQTSDGTTLSILGITLVMISSLTYAVYVVVVNKSSMRMSSIKLTFYVLLFGVITILCINAAMNESTQMLTTIKQWAYAVQLAVIPTVLSLILDGSGCTQHRLYSYCHHGSHRTYHCRCYWSAGFW